MGQRSQIYIRYNGKLIVANYYQWNYGERMISRTRYVLEKLKYDLAFHPSIYEINSEVKRLIRYCDVNFDYKDVALSSNILNEWNQDKADYPDMKINEYVFDWQDNNDGQLFIDIRLERTTDEDLGEIYKAPVIKYCFRNDEFEGPFSAEDYWSWYHYELRDEQELANRENIEFINGFALMTAEEMEEFINKEI